MEVELPKLPKPYFVINGKELFTKDQMFGYGIETRVDALETLLKVIADQQKTIEMLSRPTSLGFATEISESKPYTPEDTLAGETDYPKVRDLATASYENYYHKIRAEVSHDLWSTIFAKGFVAAEAAYNMFKKSQKDFQDRVGVWVKNCFGDVVRYNQEERGQRFLEEALELVQALGITKEGAIELVNYTYGRPVGVVQQELGGVMVTLAALCDACNLEMVNEGEIELARIQSPEVMAKIQAKQATKPANSTLPGRTPVEDQWWKIQWADFGENKPWNDHKVGMLAEKFWTSYEAFDVLRTQGDKAHFNYRVVLA